MSGLVGSSPHQDASVGRAAGRDGSPTSLGDCGPGRTRQIESGLVGGPPRLDGRVGRARPAEVGGAPSGSVVEDRTHHYPQENERVYHWIQYGSTGTSVSVFNTDSIRKFR
jgi:hypothetical protein